MTNYLYAVSREPKATLQSLIHSEELYGNGKEANWLPAPDGKFVLMMRLYWPRGTPSSIIDGSWNPPAVKSAQQ